MANYFNSHIGKDIAFEIFSHLDPRDVGAIAQVCKKFNEYIKDDNLWKKLFTTYNWACHFAPLRWEGRSWKQIYLDNTITTDFKRTVKCKKKQIGIDRFFFFKGQISPNTSTKLHLNKDEKEILSLWTSHRTSLKEQENLLAYQDADQSQIVVYDWVTKNKQTFSYQGNLTSFSIKGDKLIIYTDYKNTRIVNIVDNKVLLERVQAFDKFIIEDNFFIGCHYTGLIEIWNLNKESQQPEKIIQHTSNDNALDYHVFVKNSNIIIVRTLKIKILNFEGEEIKACSLQSPIKSANLDNDYLFLTHIGTGIIETLDINTLKVLFKLDPKSDHGNTRNPSPCIIENFLVQANTHLGEVTIWDMSTQQSLNKLKLSKSESNIEYVNITAMGFNPNSGILTVSNPLNKSIYIFEFKGDNAVKKTNQTAKKMYYSIIGNN